MIIYGTRPELIKLAPVYLEAVNRQNIKPILVSAGQHLHLVDQMERSFGVEPDIRLNVMRKDQRLHELTSRLLRSITNCLNEIKPELVLVQGDTTTAFSASLSATYMNIPIAHVEAGLRTGDFKHPFPEEMNRVLISKLVDYHFCPTERAYKNLLNEGVRPEKVFVVGNTIVDAINQFKPLLLPKLTRGDAQHILITLHRRENFGSPLISIIEAIKQLAEKHSKVIFKFPVHPNPNVKNVVKANLRSFSNIELLPPLDYMDFLRILSSALVAITDSGGVQEEAPSFGIPVAICRNETERPEILECGLGKLVGNNSELIFKTVDRWISSNSGPKITKNPFGDGFASKHILDCLVK
jgi:UDP-N-acetylglucosamine 2-epimerase (non-hydrolysing)